MLYTNASETLWFQKTTPASSSVDTSFREYHSMKNKQFVSPARLDESISSVISVSRASNDIPTAVQTNFCVQAYSKQDGKRARLPFAQKDDSTPMIPASANKLITAALVMSQYRADERLTTSLISDKKSGTLAHAYIQTSGDPTFVSTLTPPSRRKSFLSPKNVRTFDDFAQKIKHAGVSSISRLTIDNTWFDLPAIEAGWSGDRSQVGQLSALSVDEGFQGNVLAGDPNNYAASILRNVLAEKGVTVGTIDFNSIPKSLNRSDHVVATTESATIKEIVSDVLKTSDNVFAEQILAAAVHHDRGTVNQETRKDYVIEKLGSIGDITGYVFENGSGYSRKTKISCDLLLDVIDVLYARNVDLINMSSIATMDGTLTERFASFDESLQAKTGTLNGVTALTGEIGDRIVFSFIANGSFSQQGGHHYQESMVSALSRFPYFDPLSL